MTNNIKSSTEANLAADAITLILSYLDLSSFNLLDLIMSIGNKFSLLAIQNMNYYKLTNAFTKSLIPLFRALNGANTGQSFTSNATKTYQYVTQIDKEISSLVLHDVTLFDNLDIVIYNYTYGEIIYGPLQNINSSYYNVTFDNPNASSLYVFLTC